jgi:hypothetical protein
MTRSMKLAVTIAMAALLVTATGAAGAATSTNAEVVPSTRGEPRAGVARDAVSTLAARSGALLRSADIATVSGAMRYLRATGLNPDRVVIQRGVRNYAGPSCPGTGWTCTSTADPVVQIAAPGGANRFRCVTARCVVVQATATAAAATNMAKCIRTTGITQSCSISQTSATADNVAIVVEIATKMAGLTQNASSTAQITQQATGSSNSNTACVYQSISLEGSTTATKGKPVTVTLNAHQSISIAQDSDSPGGNTVQNATTAGACGAQGSPLTQAQTLTSRTTGGGAITQNENAAASGANMLIDIAQNQSPGFFGSASGVNTAAFAQTNDLVAIARTPVGPVNQTQTSPVGGLEATVNQFSHDESTIVAEQTETQCEHAQTSTSGPAPLSCATGTPPPYSLTQVQFGHVRKGPCCSTQGDNPDSTFTIEQSSTQKNDTHQDQENDVRGDCSTSGSCSVTQTTTVDGQTTTNIQTGQTVDTSITCTGTSCSTAPPIVFDGSPGTGPPPATLGPYTMTAFGPDPQPVNGGPVVTSVNDPAGTVSFSPPLTHSTVGNGWDTWSHGYTGDVYWTTGSTITMTLPAGTRAFYFYAEPNTFDVFEVTATAQDGTTSGPIQVQGNSGAKYFGFYATGTPNIESITVTTTDTTGFGVGEFGIAPAAPPID